MQDATKGINQKIVELQRLKQVKEGQRLAYYQARDSQNGLRMSGPGSQGAAGRERAEEATSEYHNKDPYTFSKHHAVSYGQELMQLETS